MTAPRAPLGVYVHYPWCRRRCPYCDFAVAVAPGAPPDAAYLARLQAELARRAPPLADRALQTIYLGGGTPSLWGTDGITAIIADVRAAFAGASPREVTLEANPVDCTPANLDAWHRAGVTRLSIGVQSLVAEELRVLGRDHRFGDGLAALQRATADGRFRVTADHILGTPTGDRAARPDATLPGLAATGVGHLSVYELTIEEGAAFAARVRAGRLQPLDDDALADAYLTADALLTAAGFEHYEISAYARPGQRSLHNQLYWTGAEFLGLGVGAASLVHTADGGAVRQTNTRDVDAYLAASLPPHTEVHATPHEARRDRVWLALRTRDGISAAELAPWPELVTWLLHGGLVERDGERLRPTLRGFMLADRVATEVTRVLG